MTTASTQTSRSLAADPLALIDVDHVRFYVGNAQQAAYFYAHTFGFNISQVADLTTGSRDEADYLLTQGNIRLLLTSPLHDKHPAAEEIKLYGDGVKDVAFTVADAEAAYEQAMRNGGVSAQEPRVIKDGRGTVTVASIKTYGRVIHTFVSRTGHYDIEQVKRGGAEFMPVFKKIESPVNDYNKKHPCGLMFVDHLVGNVEEGKMNHWVKWYEDVMGFKMFKHFDDADISTEYSTLMSKVMASGNHLIKMPINEPAEGKKKSQIQEYLEWHNMTPGVQHLALRTDDELHSVAELRRRGVDFLSLPDSYYQLVWNRVNKMLVENGHEAVREDHDRIKDLGILVDADDEGYLLQLFTKPLQDRPTLFFEIICRRGSQSFGKGNFKALFEALELEQERRGNL
ncbi:4-hydroxyphenylpyruvate dioxygenase [Nodularia spumigena]|uniref:4-hydroxyphenylpyruvate dioxygenase n=1 Tax=Nodularia spumigena TaxID=70799 RepID=UPI002B1EEC4C|nr:4-hydroxyphenylpyruvate dioxygenase [Nodularia spumigena]MEA5615137.1 4-hydroxyphenylpyruvate dioxygenase [Nodularia spumigena UHCC 0040]